MFKGRCTFCEMIVNTCCMNALAISVSSCESTIGEIDAVLTLSQKRKSNTTGYQGQHPHPPFRPSISRCIFERALNIFYRCYFLAGAEIRNKVLRYSSRLSLWMCL